MSDADHQRLAPGFLVAPPPLSDPNFDHSVVLLTSHESSGSMGFIINKASSLQLHALLEDLDITPTVADRVVLVGGPLKGSSGFVMSEHEARKPNGPGIEVSPTISISPSLDVLAQACAGKHSRRFELLLGYAEWAPNQLNAELERGDWLQADLDPELLFDVVVAKRWDEVWARLGVNPFGFMAVRGGAQA